MDVGEALAGYRIDGLIGRGGMGVVYRAWHLGLDRRVALKLIAPELTDDPRFRERFERESKLAALIDHPNVVPIYEAGEHEGRLFLAMCYVEGSDLAMLLRREGPLAPERVVRLVDQIAAALDAAHEAGLVHRDVKPANVLIAGPPGREHAYLTDFGLTKGSASQSGVTGTGQWMGTLHYVAPEQIKGDPVDARADVYALGCLLYELVTGRRPYERDSDVATLWAHLSDTPPAPTRLDPTVPRGLDDVIARALAKDPAGRYASAGQLADAAAAAVRGRDSTARDPQPRPSRQDVRVVPALATPRWPASLGVIGGFGFVLFMVTPFFLWWLPGEGLRADPTSAELVAYYLRYRWAELFGGSVWALGFLFLLGFIWWLPRLMSRAEEPRGLLSKTIWVSGYSAVALELTAAALQMAPTFRVSTNENEQLVKTLWDGSIVIHEVACIPLALMAGAAAVMAYRGRRRWLVWSCAAAGAAVATHGIQSGRPLVNDIALQLISPVGPLSFMAFVAWVGATTIVLFVDGQSASIESCDRRERIAALGGVVYVIFIMMLTVWPLPQGCVKVS